MLSPTLIYKVLRNSPYAMVSATRCHEIQRTVYIQCSALHVVKEFWETVHTQFWAILYTKKNWEQSIFNVEPYTKVQRKENSPYAVVSPKLCHKLRRTGCLYAMLSPTLFYKIWSSPYVMMRPTLWHEKQFICNNESYTLSQNSENSPYVMLRPILLRKNWRTVYM